MTCTVCNNNNSTPCGGCGSVQYCGKECQKKDWKQHKGSCKNYKIVNTAEEHGNHAVASRDIKAGEKLMVMKPDIIGPRLFQPQPCCLGCHAGNKKLLCCQKCNLPVCSAKCTASTFHQMECALVHKYKSNLPEGKDVPITCVLPLRILALKYSKPEIYTSLLELESNSEEIKKTEKWAYYKSNVLDPLLSLSLPDSNEEDYERIIGIILTNAFEVVSTQNLLVGLYRIPAMMNHDCIGNVRVSMDSVGLMTVTASVPIKKSHPIKFNYVKALDPTWIRQEQLNVNKFFTCGCARCLDPMELNSLVSAHSCTNSGCSGAVIPVEPLNMRENWSCNKCNQIVEASHIRKTLKDFEKDSMGLNPNNMNDVKKLLNKYETKLHRNHGLLCELKQMIISGYGRLPGFQVEDLKESDHKYKLELCSDVLAVLNIVEPGLNLGRGLILFELHSTVVMLANMEFERKHNANQLLMRLLEAERFLDEAGIIMSLEPAGTPYAHISANVRGNKEQLRQYIEQVKSM